MSLSFRLDLPPGTLTVRGSAACSMTSPPLRGRNKPLLAGVEQPLANYRPVGATFAFELPAFSDPTLRGNRRNRSQSFG
jgi:hypothetical protein